MCSRVAVSWADSPRPMFIQTAGRCAPPRRPIVLRALWSLLDGIWHVLKGSWQGCWLVPWSEISEACCFGDDLKLIVPEPQFIDITRLALLSSDSMRPSVQCYLTTLPRRQHAPTGLHLPDRRDFLFKVPVGLSTKILVSWIALGSLRLVSNPIALPKGSPP